MSNAYPINIVPENDSQRVAALERYKIFNAPKQDAFDKIVELAATIFKVPIAHISFLDTENEFVLASIGIGEVGLVARGESLCALTVLKQEIIVIEDALAEPILNKIPAVKGELGLRFYAGAPITTPEGYIIGTMCLVDQKPRTLSAHEKKILSALAKVAMEQVELRRINIEKTESLNFMLSQKDEFIGIASHELKTPITSLKAYLQLMERSQRDLKTSNQTSLIQKATASLNKLNSLVNDMLIANKLSTGILKPAKQDFDLMEAIYNCTSEVYEMDFSMLEILGDSTMVYADPQQIAHALRNLIDNAKKYAVSSDKLLIELYSENQMAFVRIIDTGPGIPKQRLASLFERYGTYNSKLQVSGLGLGLYISADIIKSNGGEIGVKSDLGKGTTFWFSLPLTKEQHLN